MKSEKPYIILSENVLERVLCTKIEDENEFLKMIHEKSMFVTYWILKKELCPKHAGRFHYTVRIVLK